MATTSCLRPISTGSSQTLGGALFTDFGIPGSVVTVVLWGFLAGRFHLALRRAPQSDGAALYVFWIYSVFISFVSPALGFSNSALSFA